MSAPMGQQPPRNWESVAGRVVLAGFSGLGAYELLSSEERDDLEAVLTALVMARPELAPCRRNPAGGTCLFACPQCQPWAHVKLAEVVRLHADAAEWQEASSGPGAPIQEPHGRSEGRNDE